MQNANKLLEIIINNIPNQILENLQLVYLGCNQRFADVTGMVTPQNVIGRTDYEFDRKNDHAESYREWDEKILRSGKAIIDLEESFHTSEGIAGTVLTSKVPLHDEKARYSGCLASALTLPIAKKPLMS